MMTIEIIGGTLFGSMALVADGWHMSTHVAALGIAAGAYRYARLHRHDPRFSFGTGKLGELAGFGMTDDAFHMTAPRASAGCFPRCTSPSRRRSPSRRWGSS